MHIKPRRTTTARFSTSSPRGSPRSCPSRPVVAARTSDAGTRASQARDLATIRAISRTSEQSLVVRRTPASSVVQPVAGRALDDCVAVGDDEFWGCTGTLIAPNVVLTAGHCEQLHTRVFVGRDPTKKGRIFKVKTHVRHPKFDAAFRNDLMILILEKKVTGVTPRKMASKALIDQATVGRLVGFGSTRLDGTGMLGAKLETQVPIVSQACRGTVNGRKDGQVYGCHLSHEIVAGKPLLLHDSCKGDSGGPLFVKNAAGQWLLAGTTSRGTGLHDDDVRRRRALCSRRLLSEMDRVSAEEGLNAEASIAS